MATSTRQIDGSAARKHLRGARSRYWVELRRCHSPQEVADTLSAAIHDGLLGVQVAIHLSEGPRQITSRCDGEAVVLTTGAIRSALDRFASSSTAVPSAPCLERLATQPRGTDLIAGIPNQNSPGFLLIHRDAPAYSVDESDFVSILAEAASHTVHRIEHTHQIVELESVAAVGRFAVLVAHDSAKSLMCLKGRCTRLSRMVGHSEDLNAELTAIVDLAEGVLGNLQRLVGEGKRAGRLVPGASDSVHSVVAASIGNILRTRPWARIEGKIEPDLRDRLVPKILVTVLENVIDNAVLANGSGPPVTLIASQRHGRIEFVVTDQGPGMDARGTSMTRLGWTTRADSGGQGVGLALSRDLVEFLGGEIAIVAEEGRGTSVSISLPRVSLVDAVHY